MKNITRKQAQAVLSALRENYADYLFPGEDGPQLVEKWEAPSGRIVRWVVLWEEGPDEWVFQIEDKDTMSSWPEGVWSEPYNSYVLALYPRD